jgi:hypothetical protein
MEMFNKLLYFKNEEKFLILIVSLFLLHGVTAQESKEARDQRMK